MSGNNKEFRGLKSNRQEKKMTHNSSVPLLVSDDSDDSKPERVSFFKIMINDSMNQYMTIPPAYVPKLRHLVDNFVQLKDSLGRLMEVRLSYVHGSLAFVQGWSDFISVHNIIRSDFLVFQPIGKSLFKVEIFDRSACTRLNFDEIRTDSNIFKDKSHDLPSILHPVEQANSKAADHRAVQSSKRNGNSGQHESCSASPPNGDYGAFRLKKQVAPSQHKDHVPQASADASEEDDVPCIKIEDVDCVKLESADTDDDYFLSESFSLTVSANDQRSIELTEPLPLSRTSTGRRGKHETHVVILRDASMRMWPVLYEDNYGSPRFLTGWESFANANIDFRKESVCHFRKFASDDTPAAFQVTCMPQNSKKNVDRDSKRAVENSEGMHKCSKHEGEPRKMRFI